eukprot:668762-Prymnesium_polylepis.1
MLQVSSLDTRPQFPQGRLRAHARSENERPGRTAQRAGGGRCVWRNCGNPPSTCSESESVGATIPAWSAGEGAGHGRVMGTVYRVVSRRLPRARGTAERA